MSHSPIRKDKTCLNCRHVVDQRFCPNCGQENTESRKTFHHLFIHFFEDLTHYENAFWRTIKNLLFKPAALTTEYLSGKRLSYLAPVRLYIFISFVTFFLIAVMPGSISSKAVKINDTRPSAKTDSINPEVIHKHKKLDELKLAGVINQKEADSLKDVVLKMHQKSAFEVFNFGFKSIAEIDSIQKFGKAEDKLSGFEYWFVTKTIHVNRTNTPDQIKHKFKAAFIQNFPKVLFIYMPLFAFFLWLFHGKKRWYYFDHGIFTLHYFSFLLLITLLIYLINKVFSFCFGRETIDSFIDLLYFVSFVWMIYYFYAAHRRFYKESRSVSFLKSSMLFFINFVLIILMLCLFAVYTFINLH